MSKKENSKATQLLELARKIAASKKDFNVVRGQGDGNRATNEFMKQLRSEAKKRFKKDFSEQKICGKTGQAVDFYFSDEETIVEVALGLRYPNSEFEKDILKAIMAKDQKHKVSRLFFISRPGAKKKCDQPGRKAFKDWAQKKNGIHVEIQEIDTSASGKK